MKNCYSITFLLSFLIVVSIKAQTTFGVKGGVNFANFNGDVPTNKSLTKINIGGFVNYAINDKFQIQPELLYQGMGSEISGEQSIQIGDQFYYQRLEEKIMMDYLTIPVSMRYFLANRFYTEFGPQLGLALNQKVKFNRYTNDNGVESTSSGEQKLDQYYNIGTVKEFDFSLIFGLGYELNNGLGFNLRYNLGITPVIDVNYYQVKNSVIMLDILYTFKKKNRGKTS